MGVLPGIGAVVSGEQPLPLRDALRVLRCAAEGVENPVLAAEARSAPLAWAGLIGLIGLLAACASGLEVSTSSDPLRVFSRQASVEWNREASSLPEALRDPELGYAEILEDVATEEFGRRGYRLVGEPADYRLSYRVTIDFWFGPSASRSIGSLTLDLVDGATGRSAWRGFVRGDIHVGRTREERRERLQLAFARLLRDFPPSQR